jgi:hypothetical protein
VEAVNGIVIGLLVGLVSGVFVGAKIGGSIAVRRVSRLAHLDLRRRAGLDD